MNLFFLIFLHLNPCNFFVSSVFLFFGFGERERERGRWGLGGRGGFVKEPTKKKERRSECKLEERELL